MIRGLLNWLYQRSSNRNMLVAALCVMTRQLGGVVVIKKEDLFTAVEIEIVENADPEGIRITVREDTNEYDEA